MFGLAIWDKALALWMVSAIGVAAMAVMPRQILAMVTRRRLTLAILGFTLGIFPLLIYNNKNHWATFSENIVRDTSDIPGKALMLRETGFGTGLFGWMFNERWQTPSPHPPAGAVQAASAKISSLADHPRRHLLVYAFVLAVLLLPVLRGTALRAALFGILALIVAWLQMATNAKTGGSVHHTILLWPLPQFVIAIAFTAAFERLGRFGLPLLVIATAATAASSVLVMNEYYFVSYSYGGASVWSDAIMPLTDYLKGVRSGNVYCVDWGILDSVRYLSHGTVKVGEGGYPILKPQLTPEERTAVLRMVSEQGAIFLLHTKDFENFPGINDRLVEFAASEGYRREMMTVIPDSFGRPVFEVYRFVKGS